MKVISKSIVRNYAGAALVLLAFLAASAINSNAKPRPDKPAVQPATVIAHVALPGASVSQLVLQDRGGKQYLYLEQASEEGFAIVDVTMPNQPNIIKHQAWPNKASVGRLQLVGTALALAEAPEAATVENVSLTRTLRVLDLSDPTNPRTVLSFSGVTSTLADDARNLVYITNSEGLWILRDNQALAAAAKQHACTSDDAYNDVASCQ